jgi:membrane associated rhomboid family serine protease
MGIYDRDYYRGSGPSFLGSFLDTGTICKWLIGVNVAVFVLQLLTYHHPTPHQPREEIGAFTEALVLDVNRVLHGEVWRLLTYAFLHSPMFFWHIVWNMLLLWWFGHEMEGLYGPREFLVFYLLAAVLGGLAFVAGAVVGFYPVESSALGASGAVTAVLLLYACHFPTRNIFLFYLLPIPIWLFVIVSVGMDLFGLLSGQAGGVAVSCHLGGAAFGFLYYRFQWRISPLIPNFGKWVKRQARPRLRLYREEAPLAGVAVPAAGPSAEDEQLEAKMDAILEKISRTGKESLTDHEREILLRASEIYRKRRN